MIINDNKIFNLNNYIYNILECNSIILTLLIDYF